MERLTIAQCRKLIEADVDRPLTDEEVLELRDILYAIGDVVSEAFADLDKIDQRQLEPDETEPWLYGQEAN